MLFGWAVVVAQLVERSLLIPEVRGLNTVKKNILNIYLQLLWKDENKKEAENGPFLKKTMPFGRADIADTRWPNLVPNQLPEF